MKNHLMNRVELGILFMVIFGMSPTAQASETLFLCRCEYTQKDMRWAGMGIVGTPAYEITFLSTVQSCKTRVSPPPKSIVGLPACPKKTLAEPIVLKTYYDFKIGFLEGLLAAQKSKLEELELRLNQVENEAK